MRFTRSKKVMYDNLSATRRRFKYKSEVLRILAEYELEAVRRVLGLSFGVGIMQPIPSLKQLKNNPHLSGTVWLKNNDPVRIVTCSLDGMDLKSSIAKPIYQKSRQKGTSHHIKMMCSYGGIDIRLNTVRNYLLEISVQCRFVKVRGDSTVVRKMLCRNASDSDVGSDTNSSIIMVTQGDYITLESDKV
jgi:hypothetical protein